MAKRVFTDEESDELGKDTLESLYEAIDKGDTEKARKLAKRMRVESKIMHDLFRDWTISLYSWIGKRYGDEGIAQAYQEGMGSWFNEKLHLYPDDFRSRVTMLTLVLRGHGVGLKLEEDDEKVIVMPDICSTGGEPIKEGYYGPPRNYMLVKKAQPQTFDRENFPVYCCHCWWTNALPLIAGVQPPWLVFPSEKLGYEPCQFHVYKDPRYTPNEVYESVERTTGQKVKRP